MPSTWTERSDMLLLLEMFREAGSPSLNLQQWDKIAAKLPFKATGSACMQRFRKQINKTDSKAVAVDSPAKSTSKSTKRKAPHPDQHNNEDDEETKTVTPKRAKKQVANAADTPVKVADHGSEDEDMKEMFKTEVEEKLED